jgi:hypothetical protein
MNNKNGWKWNALVIAAAVAASAANACAQEVNLKATVPFAFSINGGAKLAPGIYIVTRNRNLWLFQGEDSHQSAATVTAVGIQGRAAEKPSLTFACVGQRCQIRTIYAGGGQLGAELPEHRLSKSDAAELAVVNVPLERAAGE